MVLIQWYSGNFYYATWNKTYVLPIAYTVDYWIIGVGFWMDVIGAQEITNKSLIGFSTTSNIRGCGTTGWISIGF